MGAFRYYQVTGGEEVWTPIQANLVLDGIKPTFVTVLTLDRLLEGGETREDLDGIKYQGPLYFDLDDAESVVGSIEDARILTSKLQEYGLTASDMDIYLSGKKGLHITIPQTVFMEKPAPIPKLVPIYKEMAFKVAVDTLDWRVYTAKRGRMWRTCYNVRENGNYRVPITLAELQTLTAETYAQLCKVPRTVAVSQPEYRPRFGLVFEAAKQKIGNARVKRSKPVSEEQLKLHAPIIGKLLKGEGIKEDAGFNQVAMQVALYAREKGWNDVQLYAYAEGLITKDLGWARYNSESRRKKALYDMLLYVQDNPSYEYGLDPIKALVTETRVVQEPSIGEDGEVIPWAEEDEQDDSYMLSSGVQASLEGNYYYISKGEEGIQQITNFVFTDVYQLLDRNDGTILGMSAVLRGNRAIKQTRVSFPPTGLTGSTILHNIVAPHGGTFTGTDMHARGLYQIMLHTVSAKNKHYIVDSEGINLITVPSSDIPELREPFIAWADQHGVRVPKAISELGVNFRFQGWPEERGVLETDLTMAPHLPEWIAVEENKAYMKTVLESLFECHPPEVVGKVLGWMVACNYRQHLHHLYNQFPLLHVYGSAGSGKTSLLTVMQHLFFYRQKPPMTSPSSTPFALLKLMGGSASIPVVLDEYKPGAMPQAILERYRALLRDAFNMRKTQRGGGSAKKDNFNAMSEITLSAPVAFVGEAVESETALAERMVLVTLKKQLAAASARGFTKFLHLEQGKHCLSILGFYIATRATTQASIATVKEEFDACFAKARDEHMLRPGDEALRASGEMTSEEYARRASLPSRNFYCNLVAQYGLTKFRKVVERIYGHDFDVQFDTMHDAIFSRMAVQTRNAVPEYIKVLSAMSDMTRLLADDPYKLVEGLDYNLGDWSGKSILVLVSRAAYNKYRGYCRSINRTALYHDDTSFAEGIRDIPQHIRAGTQVCGGATTAIKVETALMDLEELIRAGVPEMAGTIKKPVGGSW